MCMKILKYTFIEDKFGVVDGEVVELDPIETTLRFSLTLNAMGMFEEEYGESVIEVLLRNIGENGQAVGDEITSRTFVMALASATYLKVENNEVYNNNATKDEFKTLPFYKSVASDIQFVSELIKMSFDCIMDRKAKGEKKGKN